MKKIIFLLATFTLFLGCSSDDDSGNEFDGSLESIEDFFTPELVEALQDLGFIINEGGDPPNIEGTFFSEPFRLAASTVSGDFVGQAFPDYTSMFSNQDNSSLTIDFNGSGGSQVDEGFGSLVSGEDDRFSVYLKVDIQINNSNVAETGYAISGRMTDDGIEDFQLAILMLDDNGDPDGVYIENNTGRLIVDIDDFSPRQ